MVEAGVAVTGAGVESKIVQRRMNAYKISSLVLFGLFIGLLVTFLTPLKNLYLLEPSIKDILPKDFFEKYSLNRDEYIFIDVRTPSEYNEAHAKGSINMPIHTLYDQRVDLPKHGKTIVLICSGKRLSGVAYHYLEHFGFLNLRRIEGGIKMWEAEGLPVVFGP